MAPGSKEPGAIFCLKIAELETGRGHWNSPIVVDGKIALPEGNANEHASAGVLDIWSLPARK